MYPRWIASSAAGASSTVQRSSNDHTDGSETSRNVISSRIPNWLPVPPRTAHQRSRSTVSDASTTRPSASIIVTPTMLSEPIPNRRDVSP